MRHSVTITAVLAATCLVPYARTENAADSCGRAYPEPIVSAKASGVARHTFDLRPDREAIESIVLKDGLRLQVLHSGCEDYALTLTFTLAGPSPKDGFRLLREAADSLDKIHRADPDSRTVGISAMVAIAQKRPTYNSGEEITDDQSMSYLTVTASPGARDTHVLKVEYALGL